jgi:hypothetical protein
MAKYRQLTVQDGTCWSLMIPTNAWEALRIAWMLWRHPDRVAVLVGVKKEYFLAHTKAEKAANCTHDPADPQGCYRVL